MSWLLDLVAPPQPLVRKEVSRLIRIIKRDTRELENCLDGCVPLALVGVRAHGDRTGEKLADIEFPLDLPWQPKKLSEFYLEDFENRKKSDAADEINILHKFGATKIYIDIIMNYRTMVRAPLYPPPKIFGIFTGSVRLSPTQQAEETRHAENTERLQVALLRVAFQGMAGCSTSEKAIDMFIKAGAVTQLETIIDENPLEDNLLEFGKVIMKGVAGGNRPQQIIESAVASKDAGKILQMMYLLEDHSNVQVLGSNALRDLFEAPDGEDLLHDCVLPRDRLESTLIGALFRFRFHIPTQVAACRLLGCLARFDDTYCKSLGQRRAIEAVADLLKLTRDFLPSDVKESKDMVKARNSAIGMAMALDVEVAQQALWTLSAFAPIAANRRKMREQSVQLVLREIALARPSVRGMQLTIPHELARVRWDELDEGVVPAVIQRQLDALERHRAEDAAVAEAARLDDGIGFGKTPVGGEEEKHDG